MLTPSPDPSKSYPRIKSLLQKVPEPSSPADSKERNVVYLIFLRDLQVKFERLNLPSPAIHIWSLRQEEQQWSEEQGT